jgi:alpha,alpha-trehalase
MTVRRMRRPSRAGARGRRSAPLAAALWLLCAAWGARGAAAAAPLVATPAQLYGPLFARAAMRLHLNLCPAIPRTSPLIVMRRYRAEHPRTRAALRRFVEANFVFPKMPVRPIPRAPTLSAHIARLWPILTRAATVPRPYSSRVYVPKPYLVPGGMFQELYYWDSYFDMLGLVPDGHMALVRDMVEDFDYLLDTYGHIPNATRTYLLSRSQPPDYYLMVGLLDHDPAKAWASHLGHLEREYAYWMRGAGPGLRPGQARRNVVEMPDGSLLNRYWSPASTPRDEAWRDDVLTARASGRSPARVYRNLRAAAESGWDFSSRWLADRHHLTTIRTTGLVPPDLNSLLYGLERAISRGCAERHERACARTFAARAHRRRRAMDRYLWDSRAGYFMDYDWRTHRRTGELSAATLYPLFVGLASARQAGKVEAVTRSRLLEPGGLVTTTIVTGQQWDAPNGWAPLQWIAVRGLARYGHRSLAHTIARRWVATVRRVYANTGKLVEKYDVEHSLPGGGGQYPLQDGFGWTNGVTEALLTLYPDLRGVSRAGGAPADRPGPPAAPQARTGRPPARPPAPPRPERGRRAPAPARGAR